MPFLPLYDSNPLKVIPFQIVTVSMIAICVGVFLWQNTLADPAALRLTVGLGTIPATLFGERELSTDYFLVPAELTLVTSMFVHGGWMHLIGNMLYLWVFGDNVEDEMGHGRYLAFYLICGVSGGLLHAGLHPDSMAPTVGASGAISGIIGAYIVLHPRVKVLVLVLKRIPIRLPAYMILGGWIAVQVFNAGFSFGEEVAGTAWLAHIGGLLAGLSLVLLFRRAPPKGRAERLL